MKNKLNKVFSIFIFTISIFAFSSCIFNSLGDYLENMLMQMAIKMWHIQIYFEEDLSTECYLTVEESNRVTKNTYPKDFDKERIIADVTEKDKLRTCFGIEEIFNSMNKNIVFKVSLYTENGNTYEGQVFIEEAISGGAYQKCELTNTNNKEDIILCYFLKLFSASI